jgi:mono/diheme cytochrome c family protein
MKTLLACLLFTTTGFAAANSAPAAPTPNTERLFRVKCAPCHGADGAGGTGASFKGKLAHRTTPALAGVIKEGIPGTAMPGNPNLPDPVIHDLALYVQYLNKKK